MTWKEIIESVVVETPKGRVHKMGFWKISQGLKQMFPNQSVEIDKFSRKAFLTANDLKTEVVDPSKPTTTFLETDPEMDRILFMQTEKGGCAGCNEELQAAILEAERTSAAQSATGEQEGKQSPPSVISDDDTSAAQSATGEKKRGRKPKSAENADNQE